MKSKPFVQSKSSDAAKSDDETAQPEKEAEKANDLDDVDAEDF